MKKTEKEMHFMIDGWINECEKAVGHLKCYHIRC